MKKIVLFLICAWFCCLNLSAGELETNIQKCNDGDALACLEAGFLYDSKEKDDIKRKELQKPLFQRGCELGDGMSCFNLHLIYNSENNFSNAIYYLEIGCDTLNHSVSCQQLGLVFEMGNYGLSKNLKKAKNYYKKSCNLGSKLECNYAKGL